MSPHRFLAIAFVIAAALATSFATPRPASAHQYVINGDFEDGTAGWSLLSDGSAFDTEPDEISAHQGAGRGRIVLAQPNFRLNQSISDVPAGSYRITMSVRVESTSAVVRLDVFSDPAPEVRFSPATFIASPGEWQHIDTDVVLAGASWVSIRLIGSGAIGDRIYVDNVGFEGAAPATMTPTFTNTPLPSTSTPVPPTPTKTVRSTSTASPAPTSTTAPGVDDVMNPVLTNAGFEDVVEGLPVAWSKYGGTLSIATSPVHSGSRAARLESATESTKWLFQTVDVQGGSAYAFSAWLWHNDPNVAATFLRVSWYTSTDGSGEAIGTSDSAIRLDAQASEWRYLTTFGIVAPPEARTAKLRIIMQPASTAPAAVYADDVAFTNADPASSVAVPAATSGEEEAHVAERAQGAGQSLEVNGPALTSNMLGDIATGIVINEVLYDSLATTDADGEWIELYNAGHGSVDLAGWFITDNKSVDELPKLVLRPGDYAVIVASDSLFTEMTAAGVTTVRVGGNIGNSLNNDGDLVALIDPSGRFTDALSWGEDTAAFTPSVPDAPAGHSIERRQPGVDTNTNIDFIDNERPSPGAPYMGVVVPPEARTGTNTVDILAGESAPSFEWLPWLIAAAATGVLATVASLRALPIIAHHLRHE